MANHNYYCWCWEYGKKINEKKRIFFSDSKLFSSKWLKCWKWTTTTNKKKFPLFVVAAWSSSMYHCVKYVILFGKMFYDGTEIGVVYCYQFIEFFFQHFDKPLLLFFGLSGKKIISNFFLWRNKQKTKWIG